MSKILQRVPRIEGEPKESDLWRTPKVCYDALNAEFHFAIDLAASATDHLHDVWLGAGSSYAYDALDGHWWQQHAEGSYDWTGWPHRWGWLNPPYSADLIKPFMEAVVEQTRTSFGVVALVPDTHDTGWYRNLRWASEIRRIPHRVPYLKADGTTKAGAMFPSCVAVFRPQPGMRRPQPRIVEWSWRTEAE